MRNSEQDFKNRDAKGGLLNVVSFNVQLHSFVQTDSIHKKKHSNSVKTQLNSSETCRLYTTDARDVIEQLFYASAEAVAPVIMSTNSVVITACLVRLKRMVNLVIISPAFLEAFYPQC